MKAGYINALVHKLDEGLFEVLKHQIFSLNLPTEHQCLEEEVSNLGIETILGDLNQIFPEMKVGQTGFLIATVHLNYSKTWTDCGWEYGMDSDLTDLRTETYPITDTEEIIEEAQNEKF